MIARTATVLEKLYWRMKMSERDMERMLDEVFEKVFGSKW